MTRIVLTAADLRKINGAPINLGAEMLPALNEHMPDFEITGIDRVAEFMGQLAHESRFTYRGEIWGPTVAQKKYEGREDLGNTEPGDGSKYRGYGGMQVTGRENTTLFNVWVLENYSHLNPPDFVDNPEKMGEAPWWVLTALWYWDKHGLNALADLGQTKAITKRINGGYNGLNDRLACVKRARVLLNARYGAEAPDEPVVAAKPAPKPVATARVPQRVATASPGPVPVLGLLGDSATALMPTAIIPQPDTGLKQVQRILFDKGYKIVGVADGRWGRNTRDAVAAFRRDNGLPLAVDADEDGVIDQSEAMDADFMGALVHAPQREVDPLRAQLPSKEIAKLVPEVKDAKLAQVTSLVTAGAAGIPAGGGLLWNAIQGFPDVRAKLDPILSALSFDMPVWGWFAILAAVAGTTWFMSRRSEKSAVQAYRAGERLAQG